MKHYALHFVVLSLGAALAVSASAADNYIIDSRHTFPGFQVSHFGFSVQRGRFNKTTGKVMLDAAAQKGSVEIVVDTNSLDMGLEDWDRHLKSADFFNTEKFPTMTFKADKVNFENGKPVSAEGQFTLMGVSKPLKVEIANFSCGVHPMMKKTVCGAEISATIKRSEFGMDKFLPAIGDEVKITSAVEAIKD